jgi:hypothetical protein
MAHEFKVRKRSPHRIEIFVDKVEQLFNSMDPSPFQEKDLDDDAEEFITSWAQEYPRSASFVLVVHLSGSGGSSASPELLEKAVRNYFAYRAKLNKLEFNRLLKQGRASLLIGSLFLALCLTISHLISRESDITLLGLVRESLTIAGWVAMWRPMEIFLYEWWPLRQLGQVYEKLSRMPVELRVVERR